MNDPALEDVRSTDPVERLLEDSWRSRSSGVGRRERAVEATAAALFLACAVPLALSSLAVHPLNVPLAAALVGLYALASRMIKFPIGAGYVVPSYLVLVPMLLLLPPGAVPLLTAAALALGTAGQVLGRRASPERILLAIPDAWHSLGPAVVLVAAGPVADPSLLALVYAAAFAAGCVLDLISATVRESAIQGIGSKVQLRVIALVWLIDACLAPLGLLVAHAAVRRPAELLLLLPVNGLLLVLSRDRNARIEGAQRNLEILARERTRLQTAVVRFGEALAAKLDLDALTDIVLRGSIEALDADGGRLTLSGPPSPRSIEISGSEAVIPALRAAAERACAEGEGCQLARSGVWALALPFGFASDVAMAHGAVVVARADREFRDDEREVMQGLVERAGQAATDIVAHQLLRQQAYTDALTKLGNRRKLNADIEECLACATQAQPLVLLLFDLDGFKGYNDTFGHLAGDALLARLGSKLSMAVAAHGSAYRLGGDEFCALLRPPSDDLETVVAQVVSALEEHGENFAVGASYGAVLLPHEATNLDYAMQLADERMYTRKNGRSSSVGAQTRDVLVRIIHAKRPSLGEHSSIVAELSVRVGRRLGMAPDALDELTRAAELHDVGKVGIPDAILEKQGTLTEAERSFTRHHTVLGERILSAVPALRPVALLVRSTHERWDGRGYPDGLAGQEIPLGSRIIAACDAYEAMTSECSYRPRHDHHGACAELRRQAGAQFDPDVVETLLDEMELAGLAEHAARGAATSSSGAEEVAGHIREVTASASAGSVKLTVT